MLNEARHRFARPKSEQLVPIDVTSFLELEITGFCQLKCKHCYADSGPEGDHGTMTADDWERVIDDAHALSVDTVQFIGGEPTFHPELRRLVRYALGKGLKVDVYTNLVHITLELWELFSLPGVSLGTSWYSADSDRHADIPEAKAAMPALGKHRRGATARHPDPGRDRRSRGQPRHSHGSRRAAGLGRDRYPHRPGTRCRTCGTRHSRHLRTVRTVRARPCRHHPAR